MPKPHNSGRRKRRNEASHQNEGRTPKSRGDFTHRTIGQIIVFGPCNARERRRLDIYLRKENTFLRQHFPAYYIGDHLLVSAINQALRDLALVRSEYRHAINTQHDKQSKAILEKVAKKADEIIESGHAHSTLTYTARPIPCSAYLIGSGGFPAHSCQQCGRYLTAICYSMIQNRTHRVPRTDKICSICFNGLSPLQKTHYIRYRYKRRAEPRGTGWKPEGEWGR